MSVVALSIPARSEARLGVNALKFGLMLNSETIDREDGQVFVDLVGEVEKCLRAALGTGATVLDVTNGYEVREQPKYDRIDPSMLTGRL